MTAGAGNEGARVSFGGEILDDAELVPDNLDSIQNLTAFLERKLQAAV